MPTASIKVSSHILLVEGYASQFYNNCQGFVLPLSLFVVIKMKTNKVIMNAKNPITIHTDVKFVTYFFLSEGLIHYIY